MTVSFQGKQFKVELVQRGKDDNHACVWISSEDDGHWYEVDTFSSYWLDELIEVLQKARKYLETCPPDMVDNPNSHLNGQQCGWLLK